MARKLVLNPVTGQLDVIETSVLPTPTALGQMLYSHDGVEFRPELPVINDHGFIITNDMPVIVVKG